MYAALARLVEAYRRATGLSAQEALAQVGKADAREAERILTLPPDQPTWLDLNRLADRDAGAAARLWEEIKAAALDELRSGHRAAGAMLACSPWERARFLAIRRELAEQWQPRGGVEWQLVEAMAQAQAAWTFWLEAMMRWAALGVGPPRHLLHHLAEHHEADVGVVRLGAQLEIERHAQHEGDELLVADRHGHPERAGDLRLLVNRVSAHPRFLRLDRAAQDEIRRAEPLGVHQPAVLGDGQGRPGDAVPVHHRGDGAVQRLQAGPGLATDRQALPGQWVNSPVGGPAGARLGCICLVRGL
jgi:hypothetical protein